MADACKKQKNRKQEGAAGCRGRGAIIATSYCFARARAPPRRFFLAGGPLASGLVAVVVAVEGETTGDGRFCFFPPRQRCSQKNQKTAALKKTKKTFFRTLRLGSSSGLEEGRFSVQLRTVCVRPGAKNRHIRIQYSRGGP